MELSEDQEAARQEVLVALLVDQQRQAVLSGPAGSGKTTLMLSIIADLERSGCRVKLIAPTGKAALRLSQVVGREATTIHSQLYRDVTELEDGSLEFDGVRQFADERTVVICDEASMVGQRLHADLLESLPPTASLLCVGDREQLPPVRDTWGADFDSPTALLTEIHRQALGSPIVQLATAIRTGNGMGDVQFDGEQLQYLRGSVDDAASWLAMQRAVGVDATLLCYTNRTRAAANTAVRAARGLAGQIDVGDTVVCTRNHYGLGLFNGEVATIQRIESIDENLSWVDFVGRKKRAALSPVDLGAPMTSARWEELEGFADALEWGLPVDWSRPPIKKRLVRAEYGECLTVHKSQGSQWDAVGVLVDRSFEALQHRDAETWRRLMYTAVTRAAKRLVVFEV